MQVYLPAGLRSVSVTEGGCGNRQLTRDAIDCVQEALGGLNNSRVQNVII